MAQEDFNPLDPYSELPAPVAPEMDLGAYMPEPYTPKARGHRGPVSHAVNTDLPPEARALLDTIAMDEAPGYDVMYGGRRFDDYSQHPGVYTPIQSGPNRGKKSSAAGRYQFLKSTWDAQAAKLGLSDFSPANQDAAAWDLAQSRYGDKTGRDLLADLRTGDPRFQQGISNALSSIWTSMPGGIEQRSKADKFLNRYAESLAQHGGEMAPQGPQGETYDIPLSNGQTLTVPKGVPREQAINDLRSQGMDVMGVTTYELTNDKKLTLPENVNIADALADLQKQFPDQEWMTKAHAEKTGLLPGIKSGFQSIGAQFERGAGELMQNPELAAKGKAWQEELARQYEAPLETDPLSKKIAHYAGSALGGLAPMAGAAIVAPLLPEAAAMGALGAATLPIATGSLAERYDAEGKPFDPYAARNIAAEVGETGLQMMGLRGLSPVAGQLGKSAAKGAAGALAADVPSVAVERAAAGQELLDQKALEEYGSTALADVLTGGALGAAGAHIMRPKGAPGELPPEQAALSESLAPTEGPAETIEDLEAQARGGEEFFRKAQEAAPMEPAPEEIPEPTVRGREQPLPPMGEMPPEEVIPEPTVREEAPPAEAPPEPHFAQSILGLKPNGALSKRLSQYDLNNLEHHGAIEEEINKSPTNIPAENLNALEARMKEITDASQIESTTPPDGGGIKQPQAGEAEGYPPIGGEGIPPSDQVGKKATGEGKVPEEVTPLSREEFAQRIGAEAPPTGKIKAVHNPELAKATQAGDTEAAVHALSQSSNPVIAHIGEKAKDRNILRILAHDQQLSDAVADARAMGAKIPKKGVGGMYRGLLGDILVQERHAGNEHVVGHEVAHAIVMDAVDAPTPEQTPHVNALKSLHKYVKNLPEFKNMVLKQNKKTGTVTPKIEKEYGVSDVQEFIAEGLSNPDFQHRLSQIKYQNTTAWGRFTGAVAKILGLKNDNAFAEFLSHTEQLIDKIQPTREAAEPKVRFAEEDHPTTDSTGQRIHPTDEGVKNFWNWFGGSRMFDGERKPLRLYHGTKAPGGFDVFDRTKSPYKGTINEVGSWFTENPEIANTFAGASERVVSAGWEPTGQSVVPVYARIEKPLYIDSVDELASLWKKHAGGDETLKNGNADQFRTWLKDEAGYDGIIMSASDIDPSFKDGLYVLALDPDIQVKSAIGNVGEFDTTKKDIRFMEEEPDHQRYSDEAIDFANKQNWFEKFYTPIRQSLVSAKAPLESLLSKLPLYDENNEVRSAVKLAQATRDSQIISNGLEHGFLHRNAQGIIEAVFDPRLAPGNLRKRMMGLPEEARGKFAEAMTTLAQAGHNLRGVEMKAIMDDAQQKISIGQAHLDRIASNYEKAKGKLEAAQELSRRMGNTQAKEMVAKAKEDLAIAKAAYISPDYAAGKKHVAAQQSLLKAVREQFHKAKRDESGKIYDISKEQEQAAKDFLNSSPEVKQLASDVRELLTNNAKLLKDAQVISKETYKKFTDDKYNYAPLYMSIEDLDTALPAAKMYMQGEQRKVMTVKGLKGSQHEVNFFQNILTHQARVGAMALHNNARLGALHDLEALGHAEKMPGNATPTIKQQAVAVMEDGKRHYYLVKDRPLYEAFEINRKLPLPEFMTDVTRNFSKLQLVNPKYWYNQILREPFMATMTSRAGIITPAHAGKELASLVFSALTKQDTNAAKIYRELKSQGVTGSHEYLRDLVKEKGTLTETSGAKAVAKNATEFASTIHEYVDAATKIAVMRKAITKAKSGKLTGTPILDEKAARDAAIAHVGDMLNFYNRGHSNTAKFIVQTTPFFNSWAQGMDSLVRNATGYGMSEHEAKQARQMFVAHAAALMAFSAAITAFRCMYSEDYRNAKPDDWAANWLIPMPEELQDKEGRMFKAKGPFELSTLFKLGPEIAVRRAFGLDHGKDTGKIVSDSAWRDLAPPGAEAGFMPFILKGAAELAVGREIDIRPILSGKEPRKLWNADIVPMLRGKGESPIADALAFGDLSPAAVRHLGQSYFGEMFTALDAVAKGAASTFGSKTARADLRDITEKAPWVNAIITNPDKLDMATGYDFAEEQALNRNSLRYAKKHGIELTPEEKAELKESGRYGKQATRIKDSIAKINKSMDKLKNDPDYTDAMQAEYEAKNQRLIEKKRKKLEKLEALKTKAEE